jgi:hypothetical protein
MELIDTGFHIVGERIKIWRKLIVFWRSTTPKNPNPASIVAAGHYVYNVVVLMALTITGVVRVSKVNIVFLAYFRYH